MKFDVEIENYSDPSKCVIYNEANVSYSNRRMHIQTKDDKLLHIDHVELYCISSEYILFTCYLRNYEGIARYDAGEITLRKVGDTPLDTVKK